MNGDVAIKLIFASSMTVMYSVLFVTLKPDTATAVALATAFTNSLTAVIVRNLTQRKAKKEGEGKA